MKTKEIKCLKNDVDSIRAFVRSAINEYSDLTLEDGNIAGTCGECTGCCCNNYIYGDPVEVSIPDLLKISDKFYLASRSTCWVPLILVVKNDECGYPKTERFVSRLPHGFKKAMTEFINNH